MSDLMIVIIVPLVMFAIFFVCGRLIGFALGISDTNKKLDALIQLQRQIAHRQGVRFDEQGNPRDPHWTDQYK